MDKFMNWLSNSFAPAAQKLFARPWISAVASSMQKIIPFILTGSVVYLYKVIQSYVPVLPSIMPIANFSFGLITLIVTFVVCNQVMEKLKHPAYVINSGLTAIGVLMMIAIPVGENEGSLDAFLSNLGPSGMAVGIIVGLLVAAIYNAWAKLDFLADSSIPDFVTSWINNIIPAFISLLATMILVDGLGVRLYDIIIDMFMPVSAIAQTLPGFIVISLLHAFFYTLGISTWLWSAITTPIFMAAINENVAAVAAGLPATNIVTSESFFTLAFITMGGVCATLGLNILMCFSKSKQVKLLGRVFIVPSIFNINEPVMFGAPVVFNPILMLPAWINAIVGPIYVWILESTGLLNIPSTIIQVGQVPAPITSVMVTQDLRFFFNDTATTEIYTAIWFPFFKVYEKGKLAEEAEAAEAK